MNPPPARRAARHLLPTLTAGFLTGFLEVALTISFVALIFAGPLAAYFPRAIGMGLAGAVIGSALVALLTSRPGFMGGNQDVPAAILGVSAAAINGVLYAAPARDFATVSATIILTTFLTGLFFLGLGSLRLGELVRFLPHPVVGGFLAGTGWLLLSGGVSLMVEPAALGQAGQLLRWLPGLLLGGAIYLALQRYDHYFTLPLLLLGAVLLFFGTAVLLGFDPAALSAGGWLLGPFPDTGLWQPIGPAEIAVVDWGLVLRQAPLVAAVALISAVSLLLNATGLELTIRADVDLNQELRAAGLANMAASLVGGLPGYQQLGLSTLNFRIGAANRFAGLVAAALCLIVLLAGASFLAYIPRAVVGGLLVYLGLSFLGTWLIAGWRTLPRIDYAIMAAIFLITAVFGFLQAVAAGLLLAIILFAVSYSRVDIVRHELDGTTYQSRVTRAPADEALLRRRGAGLAVYQLQGFIFFGTADRLLARLRRRLDDPALPPLEAAVFDLGRVTGLDATAALSFRRMLGLARKNDFALLFAGAAPALRRRLERGGLDDVTDVTALRWYPSLDAAVAAHEEALLARQRGALPDEEGLEALLARWPDLGPAGFDAATLLAYFTPRRYAAGSVIAREGEPAGTLYLLVAGQVTIQIDRPGGGPPVRLQTTRSARFIGEIGFYLGGARTADILADVPSTLYSLDHAALARLEAERPAAAAALHRLLVRHLAERVTNLTRTLRALER